MVSSLSLFSKTSLWNRSKQTLWDSFGKVNGGAPVARHAGSALNSQFSTAPRAFTRWWEAGESQWTATNPMEMLAQHFAPCLDLAYKLWWQQMLIINITVVTFVSVTLLYTSCTLSPSQLWHHWCDKWLSCAGAWRWVCVCKSTKRCNKGWRQGIAWACIREFCMPEMVLLLHHGLLRPTLWNCSETWKMSSVFHKYSANKNSCCASAMHKKETCFSGPDSGRFFAFFFYLWAWISGEGLNYG